MKFSDVRRTCGRDAKVTAFQDRSITSVTHDSRRVREGSLFVAVRGEACDGHRFIPEAIRRGAVAIVAEEPVRELGGTIPTIFVPDSRRALARIAARFYDDPSSRVRVIGATGTNGKTTTTYLVRSVFEQNGARAGLLGTIQHDIGRRRIPALTTTPDPVSLMEYLDDMAREKIAVAAMEVSSHALEQHRVAGVRFETAIFTNLTGDHLDYHGDMGRYREAKGLLFRGLDESAVAVLNEDDRATRYYKEITKARVIGYGLRGRGEVTGLILEMSLAGTTFQMRSPWGDAEVHLPLIGRHNVANALAAASAGFASGLPIDRIVRGLECVPPVPGRQEIVSGDAPFGVMVDFAHTDDALGAVLCNLRPLVKGKLIVVFGCGGDRDRSKRPRMGSIVQRHADFSWITSDNPRSESPESIVEDILTGIRSRSRVGIETDRERAIREAVAMARPGDLVVIAGKGHETSQILGDRVVPFSDREVAVSAIEERMGGGAWLERAMAPVSAMAAGTGTEHR